MAVRLIHAAGLYISFVPKTHRQGDLEEQQVLAFMRGEAKAFHHVYAAYRQRVLAYCLYFMGDEAIAKDAFQEVFLKVHMSCTQLREPKALTTWLLMITRSVCLNMLRSSRRQPEWIPIEDGEQAALTVEDEALEIRDTAIESKELSRALARLAPIYREAFLLREFDGYEYEEIAKLTSMSVPAIQVRVTRAKSMLRKLLLPTPAPRPEVATKVSVPVQPTKILNDTRSRSVIAIKESVS